MRDETAKKRRINLLNLVSAEPLPASLNEARADLLLAFYPLFYIK